MCNSQIYKPLYILCIYFSFLFFYLALSHRSTRLLRWPLLFSPLTPNSAICKPLCTFVFSLFFSSFNLVQAMDHLSTSQLSPPLIWPLFISYFFSLLPFSRGEGCIRLPLFFLFSKFLFFPFCILVLVFSRGLSLSFFNVFTLFSFWFYSPSIP